MRLRSRSFVVAIAAVAFAAVAQQPALAWQWWIGANAEGSGCALLGVASCDLYMYHSIPAPGESTQGICNANGCNVNHYCFMSVTSNLPGSATMTCNPNGWQQCVFTSAPGDCYDHNKVTYTTWVPMNLCVDFTGRLTVTNTLGTHDIAVPTLRACADSTGAHLSYV